MTIFQIVESNILVDTGGDPDEVMRVKRLPGREYNPESALWVVPILPGISQALKRVYGEEAGGQVAALVEDKESLFLSSLEIPGPIDPFAISANEACNIAMTHHLYTFHKGDRGEYAKNHYPFIFGE